MSGRKYNANPVMLIAGLVLMCGGFGLLALFKANVAADELYKILSIFMIIIGCGLFGSAAGELLKKKAYKNHPQEARQIAIEEKDERNIAINDRAKGKAFDIMSGTFGGLFLILALLSSIDFFALLLLLAAYSFVHGVRIYYLVRFRKEM